MVSPLAPYNTLPLPDVSYFEGYSQSCALLPGVQGLPPLTEIPVLYSEREKWGGGGIRTAGKLEETGRDKC